MCSFPVNIIFVFVVQVHAEDSNNSSVDEFGSKMVNKLFDRVPRASSTELRTPMLGKPGQRVFASPRVISTARPVAALLEGKSIPQGFAAQAVTGNHGSLRGAPEPTRSVPGSFQDRPSRAVPRASPALDIPPLPTSATSALDDNRRTKWDQWQDKPFVMPSSRDGKWDQWQDEPFVFPGLSNAAGFQDFRGPLLLPAGPPLLPTQGSKELSTWRQHLISAQIKANLKEDPKLKPLLNRIREKRERLVTPQKRKDLVKAAAALLKYPSKKIFGTARAQPRNRLALRMQESFAKMKEVIMRKDGVWDKVRGALTSPYFALFMVPVMWAAYGPTMRGIYALDAPPSSAMLTTLRAVIITGFFFVWEKFQLERQAQKQAKVQTQGDNSKTVAEKKDSKPAFNGMVMAKWAVILGVLNFMGTALHTDALTQVSATKAAFLVSIKTVFVPLIAAIEGQFKPTLKHWITSIVALAGTFMIVLGKGGGAGELLGGLTFPDFELFISAISYAASTVAWSKALNSIPKEERGGLLTRKNAIYAGTCLLWLAAEFLQGKPLWPNAGWTDMNVWVGILASCVFTGVLGMVFQAKAQATIPPQEAQIAYTLTPVFAAMMGIVLLNEQLGPIEAVGAATVVGSALLAQDSSGTSSTDTKTKESNQNPGHPAEMSSTDNSPGDVKNQESNQPDEVAKVAQWLRR